MEFISDINRETLIICNDSVRDKIISLGILKPIKIMNIYEFMSKYLFSYDEDAILYVMDKYNVKYDIAHEYINNLYYVNNGYYNNSKLDFLVNLKKELNDNNLLIHNDKFIDYVRRVKIVLYDIDIDNYILNMLSGLDYQIINREYHDYKHMIYEFDDIDSEVNYVAKSICKLIDEGIDISNIKLTNIDNSYYNTLERIFSLYNLRVNIPYETKLNSYILVKEFIRLYKEDNDISLILDKLNDNSVIYNELVKVINKYLKYDNKELLIYKIENSVIRSNSYDKGIEIIDYLDYISNDSEYIFMLGFNEGIIPKNYMDTEYITDNICEYVLLDNTRSKNRKLKERIKLVLGDIKNLVITYKLRDYKKGYYPSNLVSLYEVKRIDNDDNISYSSIYDKIRLVSDYDNYFKYGYKSNDLGILRNNYQIKYNSYDNKYTGIDRVMDKLTLSYSKMQIYNKCAFRYYLTDILKLDIFEENFSTIIGSMVHFVMEKCLSNNDMDTDKYVSLFLGDRVFSKKEMFFLDKYKESIRELLDQVLLEREYSLFRDAMYEKKIDIDYGNNVHFVGIIDKVLYYIDNDTTYVSLIDYKTGNDDISLKYLKYGLNIQLPIYLYLSSKLGFKNVKYPGFYLQKFNISQKDYRLVGYSNSDKDTLSVIDREYDNSKIIKGLKTNNDGSFSRYSKVLSDEDIDIIKKITEEIINKVIDKIRNNEFMINPKVNDGINIGCEYCKFKDICFKTISDEETIYPEEFGGNN